MNSRKIKFTLIALVVAFVMLVSATYAWFTLSTKPEISGIQTNIGANGSLEIALLTPQTFMHPEEIKASIGSSMVNQEVTYSNLFWGNVIDLSDESYGLGQISLLPSRLDISARNGEQTVVSGGLLTVPDYGLDGRFSYFNPHVVSASYDPPYFRYSADVSFHGVRGIGTISRVTVQQAALNNARTSIQSYESATRRAMESVWRANGDALFDILYRLHGLETQEFTSADVAVILDTCSRMLGVMDYLDAATRQGIVAVFAELIWDESQFLALKSMVENPANSLADLEDMLDAQAYLQYSYSQTLSQLIQYVPQDQQALRDIMQQCYALEGTVPDRNTIYNLLHTNLLSRDHTFINENNLFNFPSELVRDNTLTLAPTDIYSTNTGIMNHIQSYAGGYNVLFTYKDSYSISVDGNDYNQRSVLSSLSSELSLLSGSGMVNEDTALLDKTYGYAIDLAVRCNTDSDLLLQTVAADRVDPNATPDPDGLLSDTQGSGSYMRFNGSVFKDQMVPLMDAIRIGFLDNRNNLIAVAKLNTSNYTEEGNEITAPLYLYDYSVAQDGSLSMGERRKGNNAILSLPEDTATVLTVVVWLDGDHVPNSLVSIMGNSIDGTLNLQFASSAELNPAFKDDPTDSTTPTEVIEYPVYISGQQVTSANADDVFGDGTVSYDPETNTLMLDGAVVEGSPVNGSTVIYGVYSSQELNVVFGENESLIRNCHYALNTHGNLTISGGSLKIQDSNVGIYSNQRDITILSGNITIDLPQNSSHAICTGSVGGTITIHSGNMIFTGGETSTGGMYGLATMRIVLGNGAHVIASGGSGASAVVPELADGASGKSRTSADGAFVSGIVYNNEHYFEFIGSSVAPEGPGRDAVYYVEQGLSGTHSFYTLNADGSRNYALPFSGTVNAANHTVTIDSISAYPEMGIWIPAQATGNDGATYSVSIDPSAPFAELDVDSVHISFVPVNGSKVSVAGTSLQHLFGSSYRTKEIYSSLDVSGLDTSNITNMSYMFFNCSSLASLDLSGFDTANVTDMKQMFFSCSGLKVLDVSGFDTSNVTDMSSMFSGCSGLKVLDVSGFDTSNVTNMGSMFSGCSGLTELDVSGLDVSNVTDMRWMFQSCSRLAELDVSGFDTAKVTDMRGMFYDCANLRELDLSSFYTGNVTDMSQMFLDCSSLTKLEVSGFDTSNVTNMASMFEECTKLTELDVSGFDTSNVTTMFGMFYSCANLRSLDVNGFDTSNVTNMTYMFLYCSGLTELDLSSFDTSKVTSATSIFSGCYDLQIIVTPKVIGNTAMELPGSYKCQANNTVYTVIDKSVPTKATLEKRDTRTIVDTGDITDSISWTLYDDGLLKLAGTGAMPNYSAASDGPWYGYRESITAVEIGEGITYLGLGNLASIDYAEITIPESVAAIAGHNGWGGQYKTVHYAGSEQQWNAIAIFDPNNTLIGGTLNAEQGNASILHSGTIVSTDISWTLYADGILTINGTGAMPDWTETNTAPWDEYANNIKYLVISDGIKYVGSYAFDGLSNLQSVKIAGSVTALGEYAFSECRNLLAVVIGEGSALQRVDQYCFNWCANLRYINMPDTVNELGALAFACCEALDRIMINDVTTMGDYTFFACESLTSITLAEGLRIIPDGAFARCFSLSEVTIPSTVTEIGTEAFFMGSNDSILVVNYAGSSEQWALISMGYRNDGLDNAVFTFGTAIVSSGSVNEDISWMLDDGGTLILFGTGDMPDFDDGVGIYDDNFPGWSDLDYHTVIIYDGITSIGDYAFVDAHDLTTVVITPSIKNLSWYAFEGCDSLRTFYVLGSEDEFFLEGTTGNQPDNITFTFYQ